MNTLYAELVNNRIITLHSEDDGDRVLITDQTILSNPSAYRYSSGAFILDPKPSECHGLNPDGTWFLDMVKVVEARNEVWERVKELRELRVAAGVYCQGYWFHTDPKSIDDHIGLKDKARDALANGASTTTQLTQFVTGIGTVGVMWKTMAGTFVPITVQLAFDLVDADAELRALLNIIGMQKKAAIDASNDPYSIDITVGWPPVYGA